MKHRELTANTFRELRIIKFLDVNKILMGCFMYKYQHELLPDIFHDYFQCVRNVHYHNTRQNYGLYGSHMEKDLGQTCIGYRGPVIWNNILGMQINPDTSEVSFKKSIEAMHPQWFILRKLGLFQCIIFIVLYDVLKIWRAKTYNSLTTGIPYRWLGARLQCPHC